jgi:hypothetical protein
MFRPGLPSKPLRLLSPLPLMKTEPIPQTVRRSANRSDLKHPQLARTVSSPNGTGGSARGRGTWTNHLPTVRNTHLSNWLCKDLQDQLVFGEFPATGKITGKVQKMGQIGPIPVFRNAVLTCISELGKAEFPTQPNRKFFCRIREAIREFQEGPGNSWPGADCPDGEGVAACLRHRPAPVAEPPLPGSGRPTLLPCLFGRPPLCP